MVVWVIGLSGAGKTVLGSSVVELSKAKGFNTMHIDGDVIRAVFDDDLGHSLEDRKKNAARICRLGKFLSDNGMVVICSVLSVSEEHREWNRQNLQHYYEVYIDADIDDLVDRDVKGLYAKYNRGEISEVVGLDLPFETPVNSDLVITNNGSLDALLAFGPAIVDHIEKTHRD